MFTLEVVFQLPQSDQCKQDYNRGKDGCEIQTRSSRHANRGCNKNRGGGCQTDYWALLRMNNRSCPKETDPSDNLCRNPCLISAKFFGHLDGYHCEHRRPETDQHIWPQACSFVAKLPLQADHSAKKYRQDQPLCNWSKNLQPQKFDAVFKTLHDE